MHHLLQAVHQLFQQQVMAQLHHFRHCKVILLLKLYGQLLFYHQHGHCFMLHDILVEHEEEYLLVTLTTGYQDFGMVMQVSHIMKDG